MALPTLSYTRFVSGAPGVLTGLLLVDIGQSFGTSVGVTGQIRTFASIMALVSALVISLVNVRYDSRYLLILGIGSMLISALGCCTAKSLLTLLLFYPLTGVGLSLVNSMSLTLLADYYPEEQRAGSVGWLVAGGSLSWVIGAQVITYLSGIGGWRLAYSAFVVTSLATGLVLTRLFLPTPRKVVSQSKPRYTDGMRAIFSKRSAVGCLASSILRMASFQLMLVYSASFLREVLHFPIRVTSILVTLSALSFTVGSLASGRIVKSYGRKRVCVSFLFVSGILLAIFTIGSYRWLSVMAYLITPFTLGVGSSSGLSLFLEQVPEYRGTMMAFTSASNNLGVALGAGLGGLLLLIWGYSVMGLSLGLLGVAGSLIIHFLVHDSN